MAYDLGTAEGKIVLDSSGMEGAVNDANKSMGTLGKSVQTASRVALTATLAVGTGLYKVGKELDSAYDKIRIGTGKTGEELEGLVTSFENVSKQSFSSLEDVSTAISNVNTRLGLTGPQLEETALQFTNLAKITGEDLEGAIDSATGMMNQFNITGDDVNKTLDWLFQAAQASGASVVDLASGMERSGAALQALGFSLEESIDLLALFEKNGLDSSKAVMGLQKVIKEAEEAGMTTQEALADLSRQFVEAGSDAEAAALGMEVFGSRGGPQLAMALRNGTISLDEISEALGKSGDSINDVAEETADLGEIMQRTKNQLALALGPAANILFKKLGESAADLAPALVLIVQAITPLLTLLVSLPTPIQAIILGMLTFGAMASKLSGPIRVLTTVFKTLSAVMMANPFILIVVAIIAAIAAFIYFYKNSEKFREFVNNIGKTIAKVFGKVVDFFKKLPGQVMGFLKRFYNSVKEWIGKAFGVFVDFLKKLPGEIAKGLEKAFKEFVGFLVKLPERAAYFLGFVIGAYIRFQIELVKKVVETGVKVIGAVVGFLSKLPGLVKDWTTKALTAFINFATDLVKKAIQLGVDFVKNLITKFTEFITWLPGFLADVISKVVQFGIDLIAKIIQVGIDFVAGLINAIIGLPGRVWDILNQIISGLPGFAASAFSGALDIGGKIVSGLLGGIGDIVGVVKDIFLGMINGIGDLAGMAWDAAKNVGGGIWNGFKRGLGINSPSYVERAAFAIEDNLESVLDSMKGQVRSMHSLSRTMPGMPGSEPFGAAALPSAHRAAGGSSSGAESVSGLVVQGPLVGEVHTDASEADALTWARRLADLTYKQLEASGKRSARVNGAFDA